MFTGFCDRITESHSAEEALRSIESAPTPVRLSEVKKQGSSFRLDTVQTKTTLKAEDAIVRINQRIFRYEKPWRSFLIEGDIIKPLWKNAVVSETKTWQKSPDGMVRIPYEISQQYDEETWSSISRGFKDFEKFTCVRFVPHRDEGDFISIQPIHGCYSSVGRVGGMQLISLNHQCLKKGKGVVEHEVMHSLGFWHEHARSDRDKYIKIEWKNVWPGYEHNFLKQNTNNLKTKYDYGSILHYSRTAFSKTGQPTLRPLLDTDTVIGQRIRLSELDLMKVNRLYNCTTYLKDKANVAKHGSLHELGRTKDARRLKYLLDIYPETAKVRSLNGNGSTGNQTTTTARGYPECFLLGTCSPTSWPTKSVPAVIQNTSVIAALKEPAPEASEDQEELSVVARVQKGKVETLFPTLTELPFSQSLTANLVTTHSLLHRMSPALTMRTLTQRPIACSKACISHLTEEPAFHQQSQNSFGPIELLPRTPHALKTDNRTHGSVSFLADSLTTVRQGFRPISWTDLPDTRTQTVNVVHQSFPSVSFPPILSNTIYPKQLTMPCQSSKYRYQRLPILPPVTQTHITGHLKTVILASQFKVPTVPPQLIIPETHTTTAPQALATDIGQSTSVQIRMATQRKVPTVTLHKKGLSSHLKPNSLAEWNKAFTSSDPLMTTTPPHADILLQSSSPADILLVPTLPVELLLASTAPANALPGSTHPAETFPASTRSADTLWASTHPAGTLPESTHPGKTLWESTRPGKTMSESTNAAD
ncbi:uncharacterized protein LOC144694744, partial [Cetorhinus maximus]